MALRLREGLQPVADSPGPGSFSDIQIKSYQNEDVAQVKFPKVLDRAADTTVTILDKVSQAPTAVRRTADNLERALLETVQRIKGDSSKKIEKNLIQSRAESIGSKFGAWLSKGNNILYAAAAAAAVLYLIFKR